MDHTREPGRKRIFVTGASGFIGGAISRRLSARHDIVALSRSAAGDVLIRQSGGTPIRGELGAIDPGSLADCDAVVHCAARVEVWGAREDYWRVNVEGTDQLLDAARAAGVRRFLHMSSEAVLWHGQHMRGVDETAPYAERTPYLYAETKAEAERRVLAANAPADAFEALALRPRLVWGPGDRTLVPEAKAVIERGAFAWLDGGRALTSTTHVSNLAYASELALERGKGGEVYFITDGVDSDFRSIMTQLLAAEGVEVPARSLPSWIARPAAHMLEATWRRLKIKVTPPVTRHAVDLMCCDCTVRIDKARRELGYAPIVEVEAGLQALREAGAGNAKHPMGAAKGL